MTIRKNVCPVVFVLLLFLLPATGFAQSGITVVPAIRTVTANGSGYANSVAFDAAGNMYIAAGPVVNVLTAATGVVSTFAGGGSTYQDDVAPTGTKLFAMDVKLDAAGNVYICDLGDAVRVVNMQASAINVFGHTIQPGTIQTVTGTLNVAGFDSGHLNQPDGIFLDNAGNLWIADTNNNAVRVVAPSGIVNTVAGQGPALSGGTGDGGLARTAKLGFPTGVAVDSRGNVYIADLGNTSIRAVNLNGVTSTIFGVSIAAGDIATVVGTNGSGKCATGSGDGGPATSAKLCQPIGVTLDAAGNLWIADSGGVVRFVNAQSGTISTITGNGTFSPPGDLGPATAAAIGNPISTVLDGAGNLYISGQGPAGAEVREIYTGAGFAATPVPQESTTQVSVLVQFNSPIVLTSYKVYAPSGGTAEFVVGKPSGCFISSGGTLENPAGTICSFPIEFTPASPGVRIGQLLLTDNVGNQYWVGLSGVGLAPQVALIPGTISTVAGGGTVAGSYTATPATSVAIGNPTDIAIYTFGLLVIVDASDDKLLYVYNGNLTADPQNVPHVIAVAYDSTGDTYLADNRLCIIDDLGLNAVSSLFFPTSATGCGYSGDGGPATQAGFAGPADLFADPAGNLYVADSTRVRKIMAATGAITTVAGNGTIGYTGDGGSATQAALSANAITVDAAGNIYIADTENNVVRKVAYNTGIISTVAGNGQASYYGDGGPATSAYLFSPSGVAVDAAGNLYIGDTGNDVIRKVDAATGNISTIAGTAATVQIGGFSGDGGPSTAAALNAPTRLKLDPAGNLYFVDQGNHRVRMISAAAAPQIFPSTIELQTSGTQVVTVSNTGNLPLTLSGLAKSPVPFPFLFPQESLTGTNCYSTITLAPGAPCLLGLAFSPMENTGPLSATVTLTDNALNSPAATQTVALSGIATFSSPALSVAMSHGGINFDLGQTFATYVVTVSNAAAGAPTSGTVTVTVNLPTGLSLVAMTGNGWNTCSSNSCSRSDILASGQSYPGLTVYVNVAANAPAQVTNSVTVSGGGSSSATANDLTNITQIQASVLSLAAMSTGGPGYVVHVPLTLTIQSGISLDTLNFSVTVTPNGAAPALSATTSFAANSALSVNTNIASGNPANQLGVLLQSQNAAFTGTVYIGDVLVTVPTTAIVGQSYSLVLQGTSGALAGAGVPLNSNTNCTGCLPVTLTVAQYLVSDVYPNTGDSAGQFGQGVINTLSLIATLRAVVNLTGFLPPACSDLFDAMDSYPPDGSGSPNILPGRPGGDGLLNTLDLIETLKRATNIDTTRPFRVARGESCATLASAPAQQAKIAARQGPAEGNLEMTPAGTSADGWKRTAIYLRAHTDLNLAGLSFSLASDQKSREMRFVAGNQSPSLVDGGAVGNLAVAWLNGWTAAAGDRVFLGYVESDARSVMFTGASANDRTGREVPLSLGTSQRPR